MHKINHANIKEWAANYDGPLFDGILCDPPYELGFMGKSWDSSGIAFDTEMWADLFKLVKPGGHLLAFSGSRTYHRMAVAIEDAGFEIRDMIEWVYGSGFPKSLNIGKAVNSLETNEWSKISKALDNIDQKSIMEVWKSNAKSAEIQLSKSITEVGNNTPKNYFVPDIAVLYLNQENKNASAIIADLNYCGLNHISEENTITVQGSAEQSIKLPPSLARYAVKLSPNQTALSWNIFIAQCDVKEWLKENTTVNLKVDEALKTLRGNKKYSNEEITSVLCAELTDILKLTILSQSNTFQNLDTKSQTDFLSAINVIITEYTAENLISNTVDILKSKAVDKLQGNEREVVGMKRAGIADSPFGSPEESRKHIEETKGTSEWEGYGTALKPAHEPCVLARKPIEGTVANNVLKHGTGGLNIDGTRVEATDKAKFPEGIVSDSEHTFGAGKGMYDDRPRPADSNPTGRFPANLIHDGSDEVEVVFPQTKAGVAVRRNKGIVASKNVTFNANDPTNTEDVGYGDSGSAARFFYTAKASKSERNAGLEGFEPKPATTRMNASMARMENGVATNDRAEQSVNGNHHPTVKPLSLTKYLATLIKPPTGGRLLVPFSGSGSEMIGALQAGWEYVEGVELTEEYIPIAEARIQHWVSL